MTHLQTLADLIGARSRELGLDHRALGHRLGYSNPAKAAGRVQALCDGHVTSVKSQRAIERLPEALGVEKTVVDATVATTLLIISTARKTVLEDHRRVLDAADAKWRASFRPHAVILTHRTCPSSIAMCALTGGIDRWLVFQLDANRRPITFVRQTMRQLPRAGRAPKHDGIIVPFFGWMTGFVVNYSPDRAVRFDVLGEPMERLNAAHQPGRIELALKTTGLANRFLQLGVH